MIFTTLSVTNFYAFLDPSSLEREVYG